MGGRLALSLPPPCSESPIALHQLFFCLPSCQGVRRAVRQQSWANCSRDSGSAPGARVTIPSVPPAPPRYRSSTPRRSDTLPKAPTFTKKQAGARRAGGRQAGARLLMPRSATGRAGRGWAGGGQGAGTPGRPPPAPPGPWQPSEPQPSAAPRLTARPPPRLPRCPRPEPRGEAPGPAWPSPRSPARAPRAQPEPPWGLRPARPRGRAPCAGPEAGAGSGVVKELGGMKGAGGTAGWVLHPRTLPPSCVNL